MRRRRKIFCLRRQSDKTKLSLQECVAAGILFCLRRTLAKPTRDQLSLITLPPQVEKKFACDALLQRQVKMNSVLLLWRSSRNIFRHHTFAKTIQDKLSLVTGAAGRILSACGALLQRHFKTTHFGYFGAAGGNHSAWRDLAKSTQSC